MKTTLTTLILLLLATSGAAGETGALNMSELETATLGGGCFWCIEAAFEELEGIESAVSGYAGGKIPNPSYDAICRGNTGHAEVVRIRFDPAVISYADLLEVFFAIHDPTTRDRQGADVGTQYRSIILHENREQARTAKAAVEALDASEVHGKRPVVTEIAALERFYPAEKYHQDYYRRNPSEGYCQVVISPKMKKFRDEFARRLK